MAYNNGRENRKWLIWKEAGEKILREHGVDETIIEQIRIDDRADFNSNRRFYHWTSNHAIDHSIRLYIFHLIRYNKYTAYNSYFH